MLETGQPLNKGKSEELRLEEDSTTLDAILPYLYPKSVPLFDTSYISVVQKVVNACDKYQVSPFFASACSGLTSCID